MAHSSIVLNAFWQTKNKNIQTCWVPKWSPWKQRYPSSFCHCNYLCSNLHPLLIITNEMHENVLHIKHSTFIDCKKKTFLYINRTTTLYFNTDTANSCFHLFNAVKLPLMAHFVAHLMADLMTFYGENHLNII